MNQSKSQVFRCFVRKRAGFDVEAQGLYRDLREQLGVEGLRGLTIFHRYDAQGLQPAVFEQAKGTVFSEPQVDAVYDGDFPRRHMISGGQSDAVSFVCGYYVMLRIDPVFIHQIIADRFQLRIRNARIKIAAYYIQ